MWEGNLDFLPYFRELTRELWEQKKSGFSCVHGDGFLAWLPFVTCWSLLSFPGRSHAGGRPAPSRKTSLVLPAKWTMLAGWISEVKRSQQLVTAQRPLHCNILLGLSDRKGEKNATSFFLLCPQKPGAVFARDWNTFSTFEGCGEQSQKLPTSSRDSCAKWEDKKGRDWARQRALRIAQWWFPGEEARLSNTTGIC